MYPISKETLDLFLRQYRQTVEITMQKTDGTEYLTDADIIQGGMSVDRYCISGDKIEIGSAIAAELTLKLDNRDGKFDDTHFEGSELFVRIGVKKWDAGRWENAKVAYVPLGYFTVDESPRKLSAITLSALDRMVQFDKRFDTDALTLPTTVGTLLEYCCRQCHVPLQTISSSLPNASYTIDTIPSNDTLTYRKVLRWIGEITATCAYIDWDGKLRMEWYTDTGTNITPALRYTSDMAEKDVMITGVQIEDADRKTYLAGTDQYALKISGNELISHDYTVLAASILEQVNGFTYRPYTCTTKALPHLYPLDKITYVDKQGVSHASIVTHWTYKPNGRVQIAAKGTTGTKESYAEADPLTAREAAILAAMKKESTVKLSSMQQATLVLNETISNSLGLHVVEEPKPDGSIVYYFCNAPTLADSNIIYTFREGGFAWTDNWNGGNPVWKYGMSRDGNAVVRMLNTYKVTADEIGVGAITADKITAGAISADKIAAGTITADNIAVGAIGGFAIDNAHIGHGMTSYNDAEHDGVFLAPAGLGLGKGKFYVTPQGFVHAESGEFTGTIHAESGDFSGTIHALSGTIGSTETGHKPWEIEVNGVYSALCCGRQNMPDGRESYDADDEIYVGTDGIACTTLRDHPSWGWATTIRSGDIRVWGNPIGINSTKFNGIRISTDAIGFHFYGGARPDAEPLPMTVTKVAEMRILDGGTRVLMDGPVGTMRGLITFASKKDVVGTTTITGDYCYDAFSTLFDKLEPKRFIRGDEFDAYDEDKIHYGGVFAEDVEEAMALAGITNKQFGLLYYGKDADGNPIPRGVRMDGLLALCISEVQKIKARVAALEA